MDRLNSFIDHTLLKPEATEEQFVKLCQEAKKFSFAAVCVPPIWVACAARQLQGSPVAVCAVVGFPTGAHRTEVKIKEAELAVHDGAAEIDMVLPIGLLKMGRKKEVLSDIQGVVKASDTLVKVILETCLLTQDEIALGCALAVEGGAHFVKTSTGFSSGGATVQDVAFMRRCVGPDFGVKASGGIRDRKTALAMLDAGANRLGASASIAICLRATPH